MHSVRERTSFPPYSFGRVDAWLFNVMCQEFIWRDSRYCSTCWRRLSKFADGLAEPGSAAGLAELDSMSPCIAMPAAWGKHTLEWKWLPGCEIYHIIQVCMHAICMHCKGWSYAGHFRCIGQSPVFVFRKPTRARMFGCAGLSTQEPAKMHSKSRWQSLARCAEHSAAWRHRRCALVARRRSPNRCAVPRVVLVPP